FLEPFVTLEERRPSFQSKPRYRQLVDDLSGTLGTVSLVVKTASADSLDHSDGVYPYAITSGPEASNWFEIRDKEGHRQHRAENSTRRSHAHLAMIAAIGSAFGSK
ncbi:hypothetical protein GN958_ATG21381, partial [Phytophthora infestans]